MAMPMQRTVAPRTATIRRLACLRVQIMGDMTYSPLKVPCAVGSALFCDGANNAKAHQTEIDTSFNCSLFHFAETAI
jgi:hypothetical protein